MRDNALERKDIGENIIAIKINRSYRENMTVTELYEVTRGWWKLDLKKARYAEYVFSVYQGIVKEVYKIDGWFPAGSIPRITLPNEVAPADRFEFVGEVAEQNIREKYIGKSLVNLYRNGEANPIKYFFTAETWLKKQERQGI